MQGAGRAVLTDPEPYGRSPGIRDPTCLGLDLDAAPSDASSRQDKPASDILVEMPPLWTIWTSPASLRVLQIAADAEGAAWDGC